MNEERFNDALDSIVNGKHPADPDPLASFASRIHEQESERMPDDRRAAIWTNLFAEQAHDTPTTGGAGPLSQPTLTEPTAFNPWASRFFQPESKRTRLEMINDGFQVSVTALAVVAIMIAAFAAFPIIRGDRGPEITPTAFAAAPTTSAPTASTDKLAMDATEKLSGAPSPTATVPPSNDQTLISDPAGAIGGDVTTATDIPWFPYPPVIDPGPAGPEPAASPWPFVPPTVPAPQTPENTLPALPTVTYRHPQAADCTVEPLTVDEVMSILEGTSSGRGEPNGELRTREPMDEETHDALADAQREWLSCRIYGSPFQMWALESDQMIIADIQRTYFPMYSMEGIRDTLTQMESESGDTGWNSEFTWDPPKDTSLPMVPDYSANSGDAVYGNGSAMLTVEWVNRNGVIIRKGPAGVPALETNLPNAWTFVRDEASGRWLLDGYGVLWGVTTTP